MSEQQAKASGAFAAPSSSPQTHFPTPTQAGVMSPSFSATFNNNTTNHTQSRTSTPTRNTAPITTQASSSLLNLLKFGSNAASPQSSPQAATASRPVYGSPSAPNAHGRGISASEMAASFTSGKPSTPIPREKQQAANSTTHQDALLRLLNQTAARSDSVSHRDSTSKIIPADPPSEDRTGSLVGDKGSSVAEIKSTTSGHRESPIRFFGSNEATPTPFEPAVSPKDPSQKNGSIFTYVNPFEQLAASSPRNTKPKSVANGDKRRIKSPSPAAAPASSRRKLTPSGSEVLQSVESPTSKDASNERTQIEALMGIGAPSQNVETVAEALNEVGDKVDQQVGSALAKAEETDVTKSVEPQTKREERVEITQDELQNVQSNAQQIAADVEHELNKKENSKLLKESMPTPTVEAVKDVISNAASGKMGDGWESAEDEDGATNNGPTQVVPVYQFPMRPFVSIDIILKELPNLKFRDDAVMHVARFKKDFDQADRTLVTASNDFIVYAQPKNGGIRIIQQDSGQNSSIFSKSQDRIFNLAISTAQSGSTLKSTQTMIATGVSGTVYWTTIAKPGEEVTQENMENQGLVIPPVSSQVDSTSGGQLKTRAKKSNRHPEFFAIGRGKSIQIIFTANAQSSEFVSKEGLMDTERYFASRSLKVTTGKAGKDFTFSEDDSTIASLDKTGKLRIWDVRDLTDEANGAKSLMTPVEVKAPILTFGTANSMEKSWPTSVLFVDKLRPYTKGTALRYIIVGMKQNHTLQLWDLCLGKAVQELRFPHDSETDAICSVTYHPASGIIAVGHPTRNSVYFIHLSAPKYNLPPMPQAKFVQRLANKDSTLPKAEATAIMSGMREFSFAEKGQIRSVELVPYSNEAPKDAEDEDDATLFELYVMHSKGVTCLGVKREDLGWSKESRVLHPVDAEKNGFVVVKELREPTGSSTSEPSAASVNGDTQASGTLSKAKVTVKETAKPARAGVDNVKASAGPNEKSEKKKHKANGATDTDATSQAAATPSTSESYATAVQREQTPTPQPSATVAKENVRPKLEKHTSRDAPETTPASANDRPTRPVANGDSISLGISGDFLDKELKKIERGVSEEFNKVLGRELEALYRRFSEDKRVQDAAGAAKQDAMLRLVSSTLSDNVEKSLSRIIRQNIQDSVVPSISDVTLSHLKANFDTAITHQIDTKLSTVLQKVLPEAIDRTMQSQQIIRSVSEQVAKPMTGHIDREFAAALNKSIVPAFTRLAVDMAQKVSGDAERRVRDQLQHAEIQRREDSAKIEQLTGLVRGLSETVQTMAAAQSDFQIEILKQQQKAGEQGRDLARQHSPTPSESASMTASPEQEEYHAINTAMNQGRFEEATVMVRC